jgi:transcriptional regulator with XRE-family HTH domain
MAPEKDRNFGPRLKQLRVAADLSRYQLAVRIGMHPNSVYRLEMGLMAPTWAVTVALADALGVSVEEFRKPAAGRGKK